MAVDQHYENFPVASLLLPAAMRGYVVDIYRFARHADDVADEGEVDDESRLTQLAYLMREINALFSYEAITAPTVQALTSLRNARFPGIEAKPFIDLLSAFSQDVRTKRYETYVELMDYCRQSANPVGRLMLGLARIQDPAALTDSDRICTALQLINFWQDAAVDVAKSSPRIYVPLEDFERFGVSVDNFPRYPHHRQLMQFQCVRTKDLLLAGSPLLRILNGRLRIEIALTIAGGLRILEKIENNDFDVRIRPTLRWYDLPRLTFLALRFLLAHGRLRR